MHTERLFINPHSYMCCVLSISYLYYLQLIPLTPILSSGVKQIAWNPRLRHLPGTHLGEIRMYTSNSVDILECRRLDSGSSTY